MFGFNTISEGEWVGMPEADPSVYPSPPDTRSGVTYGPNGNDYTGALAATGVTLGQERKRYILVRSRQKR